MALSRRGLSLAGGLNILTRVTKRSEATPADHRLDTSEYFEQVRLLCPVMPRYLIDMMAVTRHAKQ